MKIYKRDGVPKTLLTRDAQYVQVSDRMARTAGTLCFGLHGGLWVLLPKGEHGTMLNVDTLEEHELAGGDEVDYILEYEPGHVKETLAPQRYLEDHR